MTPPQLGANCAFEQPKQKQLVHWVARTGLEVTCAVDIDAHAPGNPKHTMGWHASAPQYCAPPFFAITFCQAVVTLHVGEGVGAGVGGGSVGAGVAAATGGEVGLGVGGGGGLGRGILVTIFLQNDAGQYAG